MIFNHSIINAAKAAERSESVSRNFHDLGNQTFLKPLWEMNSMKPS